MGTRGCQQPSLLAEGYDWPTACWDGSVFSLRTMWSLLKSLFDLFQKLFCYCWQGTVHLIGSGLLTWKEGRREQSESLHCRYHKPGQVNWAPLHLNPAMRPKASPPTFEMWFLHVLRTKGFSTTQGCLSDPPHVWTHSVEADGGTQLATGRGQCPLIFHGRASSCQSPAAGVQLAPPAPRRGPRSLPRYSGAASELFKAAGPGTAALGPGLPVPAPPWRHVSIATGALCPTWRKAHITWLVRALKGPAENDAGGGAAASPGSFVCPALSRGPPAAPGRLARWGQRGRGQRQDGVWAAAMGPAGRRCSGLPGRWGGPRAAGRGGVWPGGGHLRPAAFSLFPRDAEEDGGDAIILLLKRAKVRRRPLQGPWHGGC